MLTMLFDFSHLHGCQSWHSWSVGEHSIDVTAVMGRTIDHRIMRRFIDRYDQWQRNLDGILSASQILKIHLA